jgi:hypothetical protein
MKNAEELKLMAHKIVKEYEGRVIEKLHATALEFSIYDALQDAYQKGEEEMRERAAKTSQESWDRPGDVIYVSEVRHKEPYVTGKEWCDHVAKRIRALSPTEGGAR